jgi:predicted nucleic acid-binding protein
MLDCFFDSSALVKRFASEIGSAWVNSIIRPSAGHQIHIAAISGVEVVAVPTRRSRALSAGAPGVALQQFRRELANRYRIVGVTTVLILNAMLLAERHALRGYDAVQLAALAVDAERRSVRLPALTLVCADSELNAAAQSEGLAVENPNAHA